MEGWKNDHPRPSVASPAGDDDAVASAPGTSTWDAANAAAVERSATGASTMGAAGAAGEEPTAGRGDPVMVDSLVCGGVVAARWRPRSILGANDAG